MTIELPTVESLAQRLEEDIRRRRLNPGDRYFTAAEAGEKLGVSVASANRAMQLLADRKILVRRRSRGTYVGSMIRGEKQDPVKTLYVLRNSGFTEIGHFSGERLLGTLHNVFRDVGIQMTYIPAVRGLQYVREVLGPAHRRGALMGVIAISSGREVYRYLGESQIPTVVVGCLDPDLAYLPSIDADQHAAGHMITEYLVRRGHERLVMLPISSSYVGDHQIMDGIAEALTEANLPPNALRVRHFDGDLRALQSSLRQMLQSENRPTAIITSGWSLADSAAAVVHELHMTVPDDVEIAVISGGFRGPDGAPYPCVRPRLTPEQVMAQVSVMLQQIVQERPVDPHRFIIPIELCEPT